MCAVFFILETETAHPSRPHGFIPDLLMRSVMFIILLFCVVVFCVLESVLYIVPNVASFSVLSFLGCPFGFL